MKKKPNLPEIEVFSKSETLNFHYHPAVIRQNLREFIKDCEKRLESASESEKKGVEMIKFLYEDCLQIVEWASAKIQPLEDDTKKGQDS